MKSSGSIQNIPRTLRRAEGGGVTFGEVVYPPGGTYGPRRQADFQLVAVLEGSAAVQLAEDELVIRKGEVALLYPGHEEFFRFADKGLTHHSWCAVTADLAPADMVAAPTRVQPLSARLAALFEMGLGLPARDALRCPSIVGSLGLAALAEYGLSGLNATAPLPRSDDVPASLQLALDWIGQRHADAIDAPGLARVAGVSPAQLTKLFRRHLGTTPMRAVWAARTQAGVRLLRDSGLSVGEIAHRCGFQTPFHFSRWVRTMEALSPGQVRAQAWAGERRTPPE